MTSLSHSYTAKRDCSDSSDRATSVIKLQRTQDGRPNKLKLSRCYRVHAQTSQGTSPPHTTQSCTRGLADRVHSARHHTRCHTTTGMPHARVAERTSSCSHPTTPDRHHLTHGHTDTTHIARTCAWHACTLQSSLQPSVGILLPHNVQILGSLPTSALALFNVKSVLSCPTPSSCSSPMQAGTTRWQRRGAWRSPPCAPPAPCPARASRSSPPCFG